MPVKLIPLAHGSKKPLRGEDWHERVSEDPAEHAEWIRRGLNIGFPLEENSCSCADFDVKDQARRWWRLHGNIVSVAVETRRGIHCYFAGQTKTRKFDFGDLKGNGYLVYPPSVVDRWRYCFFRNNWEELQPFPEHLFPETEVIRKITRREIRRLDAYLATIESKQGQHGSHGLVRAAAILRDAGLSEADAMCKLVEWDQSDRVSPPWPLKELARAVTNTYRKEERRASSG